jgi:hypothetical protein
LISTIGGRNKQLAKVIMIEDSGEILNDQKSIKERERAEQKRKKISLSRELEKIRERLPFPGIDPEHYSKLKAEEEEFPGYVTPIDELVARFKDRGMKVVLGNNPESGNVFVLPFDSDDIENDSVFPQHLQSDGIMNGQLRELVLLSKDQIKDKAE